MTIRLSCECETVTDRQFFSSLLHYIYVQDFSRNLRKNIGSQPNFSRIFTYRDNSAQPNISRFFSAIRNF